MTFIVRKSRIKKVELKLKQKSVQFQNKCAIFTMWRISVTRQLGSTLAGRIRRRESPTCLMDMSRSKRTWKGKARQKVSEPIFGSSNTSILVWFLSFDSDRRLHKRAKKKINILCASITEFFFGNRLFLWQMKRLCNASKAIQSVPHNILKNRLK